MSLIAPVVVAACIGYIIGYLHKKLEILALKAYIALYIEAKSMFDKIRRNLQ